jgi:hypothetical protein
MASESGLLGTAEARQCRQSLGLRFQLGEPAAQPSTGRHRGHVASDPTTSGNKCDAGATHHVSADPWRAVGPGTGSGRSRSLHWAITVPVGLAMSTLSARVRVGDVPADPTVVALLTGYLANLSKRRDRSFEHVPLGARRPCADRPWRTSGLAENQRPLNPDKHIT